MANEKAEKFCSEARQLFESNGGNVVSVLRSLLSNYNMSKVEKEPLYFAMCMARLLRDNLVTPTKQRGCGNAHCRCLLVSPLSLSLSLWNAQGYIRTMTTPLLCPSPQYQV